MLIAFVLTLGTTLAAGFAGYRGTSHKTWQSDLQVAGPETCQDRTCPEAVARYLDALERRGATVSEDLRHAEARLARLKQRRELAVLATLALGLCPLALGHPLLVALAVGGAGIAAFVLGRVAALVTLLSHHIGGLRALRDAHEREAETWQRAAPSRSGDFAPI